MHIHRDVGILWLLLLLCDSGSAFNLDLIKRNREPQEGDVRLFGSKSNSEGRVEIYHEEQWGTVCDNGWGMAEAEVVCRQLHFYGAKYVVVEKDFGEAPGPIWLDNVKCEGTENNLVTCEFKNWGVTDCSHKQDVGVICHPNVSKLSQDQNGTTEYFLDHSLSLSDDLGQIFDSGKGCDFLISVQSATGNRRDDGSLEMVGETVCVHKMILSRFPLFNASDGTSGITVNVSSSCQPHFTPFIRYIYTRKTDVTFSSAQCLHWLASQFGVKQLMEDTGRLFTYIIPQDNLFYTQVSLYKYAKETGDLILQENCIQYLAWNYEKFARSPAWTSISEELLRALLARSDLVLPNEYFLIKAVETWIKEKGNFVSLETQADLLSRIRFPMIPAEKLFELDGNTSLQSSHKKIYHDNMLKAYQFNVLLFSNLPVDKEDEDYQPRIYTDEPWSITMNPAGPYPFQSFYRGRRRFPSHSSSRRRYNSNLDNYHTTAPPELPTISQSFSTPLHNSLMFKDNKVLWKASVFRSQSECSKQKKDCASVPAAGLDPLDRLASQTTISFRNKLLVICDDTRHICQIQDFRHHIAHVTVNGTHIVTYPCPSDKYVYRFVVVPEYD